MRSATAHADSVTSAEPVPPRDEPAGDLAGPAEAGETKPSRAAALLPIAGAAVPNLLAPASDPGGDMIAALRPYLPAAGGGLPPPDLSTVAVREASVGIGNLRGTDVRSAFPTVLLKGGRLDAVVRFELWGDSPAAVTATITQLQARLRAAHDSLRAAGFLIMNTRDVTAAEAIVALNAWRQALEMAVLYEYHYQDSDGALGVIARIPVWMNATGAPSMTVTDDLVRWDADGASRLAVTGTSAAPVEVQGLSILYTLPAGWAGHFVTVAASAEGATHQRDFPSVEAFGADFARDPQTIELNGRPYVAGVLSFDRLPGFPQPVVLRSRHDHVHVTYADTSFDNAEAIVYLRALRDQPTP